MITAARLTALISGVPAIISEEFIREKRWDFFSAETARISGLLYKPMLY